MSDPILGIDLGTTNSVVAVIRDGVPTILPVAGHGLLPSVVGLTAEGGLLVGHPARNQWVVAPERTVRSIKRRMGTDDKVLMAGRAYSPQEISALILQALKQAAEEALGQPVGRAVITVPAYFNETQRQATMEAGVIAGLTVERIINEPTAAALAYGLGRADDLRVLVYDLGGGTFDVSVIELSQGVIDVRATAGDNRLGGDDFDQLLAERLAEVWQDRHGTDLPAEAQVRARLLRAGEEAKIALSSAPYATVRLEYLSEAADGTPLHLEHEVTREEFEQLIAPHLARTAELLDQALSDASLTPEDIDLALLVGGSTRIPAVRDLVAWRLGCEAQSVVDPDLAVALGAAVQAGIIQGEPIDAILVDVTPFTLGMETASMGFTGRMLRDRYSPLIPRNATVPTERSEVFTTLYPGQEKIHVKVYQGEDPVASRNTPLGDFMVEDLKPNLPDGTTEVTVKFRLDVNGILDVTVVDREAGKRVSQRMKAEQRRLSPEEIVLSQAKLAAHGSAWIDRVTAQAEDLDPGTAALVHRAEALLQRPDLDPDAAAALSGALADLRLAAADDDAAAVEEAGDVLIDVLIELEKGS